MRSLVINKFAFVGILSALLIAIPLVAQLMDEQALFADLNSYYSLAALAGGFLAIVVGSARMCGKCGGDLPMEKSAGCIIAMAGLVFFYPYLADFWDMPYDAVSNIVLLFGVTFLMFFATVGDVLTAYTNRYKPLRVEYTVLCVIFFILAALYVVRMETDLIDFSGDAGRYFDMVSVLVIAFYIAASSFAAGALYRYDVPCGSGLGKTGEAFSTPSAATYLASLADERSAQWKAEDEYASQIQDRLVTERDAQAAKDQAARDAAVKAAQEKAAKEAAEKAAKEAKEKAEKEAAEKAAAEQAAREAEEKAAKEAAEKAAKEAEEKAAAEAKEAAERAEAERIAQEKAEKEAAEQKAIADAQAKEAAEKAAKDAEEKAAAEQAAKEAAEAKATEEAAAREQAEAAAKEAQEKAVAEQAAKEAAEQKASEEAAAREQAEAVAKEAQEKAAAESEAKAAAEQKAAEEKAAREKAEKRAEEAEDRANDQIVAREAAEKAAAAVAAAATAAAVSAANAEKEEAVQQPEPEEEPEGFEEESGDDFADDEIMEDIWTDNSPEALVRRAAWNKGLRCRRGYGPHKIPVAFVKGKVAVYVTADNPDTSIDDVLKSEGWIVLRYNEFDITDGTDQGAEIAQAVKAHIREMNAAKKKKKSKKKTSKS